MAGASVSVSAPKKNDSINVPLAFCIVAYLKVYVTFKAYTFTHTIAFKMSLKLLCLIRKSDSVIDYYVWRLTLKHR